MNSSLHTCHAVLGTVFPEFGYVSFAPRLLRRFTPRKDIVGIIVGRVPRRTRDGNLERLSIRNRIYEILY